AAIESGTLAARAILEGGGEPPRVEEAYERALSTLRGELRLGRMLAHLTYELPRVRRWLFRRCGQTLAERMTDILMGEGTYAGTLRRARRALIRRALRRA